MTDPSQRPSSPGSGRPEDVEALTGKASLGAAWTITGFGGRQLVRLVSNLILTRMLLADEFGMMSLVAVFVFGLELFSDIGVGPALIQNKREDPEFINTAWTVQVVRGIALWLIATALAGPYAAFYEEPLLKPLVQVGALGILIDGFRSTSFFIQNRKLNLKRIVLLEVIAQVLGAIAMVWIKTEPIHFLRGGFGGKGDPNHIAFALSVVFIGLLLVMAIALGWINRLFRVRHYHDASLRTQARCSESADEPSMYTPPRRTFAPTSGQ